MLLLFLVAVAASALFSGMETGLYTTSRLRMYLDQEAGSPAAAHARALLSDMPTLLTVLLVANNLANWAASYATQLLLVEWDVGAREVVGTLGVSAVLFLLAESLPKSAFRRGRERLLYPVMPLLVVVHRVLRVPTWPLTWFSRRLSAALRHRSGEETRPQGVREAMLNSGAAEGLLTGFQERVARGVLAMRSRLATQEALPLGAFAIARLGRPGLDVPPGHRDQRVLVLEADGGVMGWVPMAMLRERDGFRPPRRDEVRRVTHVEASLRLDRVYVALDRSQSPFAVVMDSGRVLGVIEANRLRERVIGTFSDAPADVA